MIIRGRVEFKPARHTTPRTQARFNGFVAVVDEIDTNKFRWQVRTTRGDILYAGVEGCRDRAEQEATSQLYEL